MGMSEVARNVGITEAKPPRETQISICLSAIMCGTWLARFLHSDRGRGIGKFFVSFMMFLLMFDQTAAQSE
jgi:hypothetical protein